MIKGDRVVLKKSIQGIKNGELGTIVEDTLGGNLVVRFEDVFIGIDRSSIEKAEMGDIKKLAIEKLVHPYYKIGSLYVVNSDFEDLNIGEIGFICGVNIGENEKNDEFRLDFGEKILTFNKKTIDYCMSHYDFEFESMLDKQQEEIQEPEKIYENLYIQEKIKNDEPKIEEGNYVFDNYSFYIAKDEKVSFKATISYEQIENYIESLKKLKDFIQKNI
jgi:hypothetical protein